MDSRSFSNEFPDHPSAADNSETASKCKNEVKRQLKNLYKGLETWLDWKDYSVYTGTTGIALLHLRLSEQLGDVDLLEKALFYVERPLQHLSGRRVSFLCGDAGPLAVAAVLYHKLNKQDNSQRCLQNLLSLAEQVVRDESLPDELLYGRAGYLYALLFIRSHLGQQAVDQRVIDKVVEKIVASGESLSTKERSSSPLMYEWHEKKYIGAAHGLAGIFYLLLQLPESASVRAKLQPSIDFVLGLRFPSGNFPSSIGSSGGDRLVHWCHGAPGCCHLFLKAYESYGDEKYLSAALGCGDVIWGRGLLRKGYGICHGVAGNAYAFLALYRVTGDSKHLARAQKFTEWLMDYGKHGCPSPDRPFSLFEGLAGTICFLADMMQPEKATFPAFYI